MIEFNNRATQILEEVADFFESSWPGADVDLLEDVLTININHSQYLFNKHGVTLQIWMASPYTGAHHFYFKDGEWLCTRTEKNILSLLEEERYRYAS